MAREDVIDANNLLRGFSSSLSLDILLFGRGVTVQRDSTWGQKCRNMGGLWGHEKFSNIAEAISVSAIKRDFSPTIVAMI